MDSLGVVHKRRPHGGEGGKAKADKGEFTVLNCSKMLLQMRIGGGGVKCYNFADVFYGQPLTADISCLIFT